MGLNKLTSRLSLCKMPYSYSNLIFLIICFVSISSIVNQFTIQQSAYFIVYQIFLILLPGRMILYLLKKNGNEGFMAYIIGYIWTWFSYFICMLIPISYSFTRILLVILLYVFYRWNCKEKKHIPIFDKNFRKVDYILISFVFIGIYILKLIIFNGMNLSPLLTGSTLYNRDYIFYISNVASAMKGFPINTLYTSGYTLFYHYFSSLVMADGAIMCGMSAFDFSIGFSYIVNVFVLGSSVFYLVYYFINNYMMRFLAIVTILIASGLEHISLIYYLSHIYENPFGFDIGIAFACLSIFYFFKMITKKFNFYDYIIFISFYIICCGSKGPVAAVISSGLGIACLLAIYQKENRKSYGIYLLSIIIIFFFIYLFVISDITAVGGDALHSMKMDFTGTVKKVPFLKNIYNGLPFFKVINACIAFIIYIFIANPILTILFIPACIMYNNRKDISGSSISLFIIIVTGILLTFIIHQHGFSQMYFMMSAIPFAAIFIFSSFDKFTLSPKLSIFLCFIILFVAAGTFLYSTKSYLISAKNKIIYHDGDSAPLSTNNFLTKETMQGLLWFQENTNEEDKFFTNVSISNPKAQIYAAITERQSFLEGYDLIDSHKIDIEERKKIIQSFIQSDGNDISGLLENGVTYYIQLHWCDLKSTNVNV